MSEQLPERDNNYSSDSSAPHRDKARSLTEKIAGYRAAVIGSSVDLEGLGILQPTFERFGALWMRKSGPDYNLPFVAGQRYILNLWETLRNDLGNAAIMTQELVMEKELMGRGDKNHYSRKKEELRKHVMGMYERGANLEGLRLVDEIYGVNPSLRHDKEVAQELGEITKLLDVCSKTVRGTAKQLASDLVLNRNIA